MNPPIDREFIRALRALTGECYRYFPIRYLIRNRRDHIRRLRIQRGEK